MDIKELKNYLGCDDDFLVLLMQKFIEEVNEITATIKTATSQKDWSVVKINAHKMLSSVRIFEMREVIVVLEKLEIEAGGSKNQTVIETEVNKLSILVKEVVNDMAITLKEITLK